MKQIRENDGLEHLTQKQMFLYTGYEGLRQGQSK